MPPALPAQSVEPYQASYTIHFGPFYLGDGVYTLEPPVGEHYRFLFSSELSLLLLSDRRQLSSEFTLHEGTLASIAFHQQREGVGKDFSESILWDRNNKLTISRLNKQSLLFEYLPNVYDGLNAQLQMRLDLIRMRQQFESQQFNSEPFNYQLLMKNNLDDYTWLYRGEEQLTIGDIVYPTVKFEMQRDTTKRQTFIWFSTEMNYLPLRVLYSIRGTGSIDMRLKHYAPAVIPAQSLPSNDSVGGGKPINSPDVIPVEAGIQ